MIQFSGESGKGGTHMKKKIAEVTDFLSTTISKWKGVGCIAVDPRADTLDYDPYFALVIDVYYKGKIPSSRRRKAMFGDPGAFETALGRSKDRFFLSEIPVRVEYKNINQVEGLVLRPLQYIKILKNSGTYPLFRLENAQVVHDSIGWIEEAKSALRIFPDKAWNALRESFAAKMEHYHSDLGASSASGDQFFFRISEAGFLRYAAAALFMHNRCFEPSHRDIQSRLKSLPKIPDGFWGPWDTFLRSDLDIDPRQSFEIARIITRSILSLVK
jgi:hypothetical protein